MRMMMGMMGRMMVAVVSGVKVVELSVERPTIGGKPESGGCLVFNPELSHLRPNQ